MPSVATFFLLTWFMACRDGASPRPKPPTHPTLRQAAASHGITVGAAANSSYLSEPKYALVLGSEFSQLQAENEMKFSIIHPASNAYDFRRGDTLVSFAQAHDMLVRGHTLVWHKQIPAWVTEGNYDSSQLASILHEQVSTVMGHYAHKVYAWDVVNEAFNDNGSMRDTVWYDQPGIGFSGLGPRYIEEALNWAHQADPDAKLFYNDYDAEPINAKSDAIYVMAKDFKNRGVPLDGIGFQLHLNLAFDDPAILGSFSNNLQRFADLGLELHITELDVRLSDSSKDSLRAQSKLYGKIARICVKQPQCKVLQTWGFTDRYSWIPSFYPGMDSALLWDAKYQKKPAYSSVLRSFRADKKKRNSSGNRIQ